MDNNDDRHVGNCRLLYAAHEYWVLRMLGLNLAWSFWSIFKRRDSIPQGFSPSDRQTLSSQLIFEQSPELKVNRSWAHDPSYTPYIAYAKMLTAAQQHNQIQLRPWDTKGLDTTTTQGHHAWHAADFTNKDGNLLRLMVKIAEYACPYGVRSVDVSNIEGIYCSETLQLFAQLRVTI
jgi:hypothetical protein